MRSAKRKITSTEKILSRRKVILEKMTPERRQRLFMNVDLGYRRISPINCSRNIMATHSDIDKEIEQARKKSLFSPLVTKRTQASSVLTLHSESSREKPETLSKEPSFHSITPSISPNLTSRTNNYVKKCRFLIIKPKKSLPLVKKLQPFVFITSKQSSRLARMEKIKKILEKCFEIKKEWKKMFELFKKMMDEIANHKEKIIEFVDILTGKNREKRLVEDTWSCFKPIKNDAEHDLKIAKATKRGKHVWKLHHVSFMNYVDKIIHSVQAKKFY
jgi:hypothetical protein